MLQTQSNPPLSGSHSYRGPAEPHRQHAHVTAAAHIYQDQEIPVNLSNIYILENKHLQTKDPNPLQVNPRPQGYRIRLTSVAALSDIL